MGRRPRRSVPNAGLSNNLHNRAMDDDQKAECQLKSWLDNQAAAESYLNGHGSKLHPRVIPHDNASFS